MAKKTPPTKKSETSKSQLPKFPDRGMEAAGRLPGAFELFQPSLRTVMDNLAAFLWLSGVPLILFLIGGMDSTASTGKNSFTLHPWFSLTFIGLLVYILVAPGLILLQLHSVRKQPVGANEAFQRGLHYVWRILGLDIILCIGLMIAFILLIVPFFILLPRVILAPYFLVDRDLGVFDAIRESNEAYKRYHGVWGILGVTVLLQVPSIIPIVGSIASTVLGFLYQPALAMRYEHFRLLGEGKAPQTPIEADLAE